MLTFSEFHIIKHTFILWNVSALYMASNYSTVRTPVVERSMGEYENNYYTINRKWNKHYYIIDENINSWDPIKNFELSL